MKRILSIIMCLVLLAGLSACAVQTDVFELDASKVPSYYGAWYDVTAVSGETELAYTMHYSFNGTSETFSVYGFAQEPYSAVINGEKLEGIQTIKTEAQISLGENAPYGLPLWVEEGFMNTAVEGQQTSFTCTFDHDAGYALLKTTVYDQSSETKRKEQVYTIRLNKQYFDKDTLPFLLAGFPEGDRTISVASGNRDKLQSVRAEQAEDETLTTPAGTFTCRVFVLRPATVFAVTSARVWIDRASGAVVQVEQEQSRMTLKKFD